jgi:hypothetical protein
MSTRCPPRPVVLAWVLGFAVVSPAADMVNEGARSVAGPLLARLISGGTKAMVFAATVSVRVAGRTAADVGELGSGRVLTQRSAYLPWPARPSSAAPGPVLACILLTERTGRDTQLGQDSILSAGRRIVGLVRGFVTYNALDQVAPSLAPACHSSGRGRLAVAFSIVRFVAVG